MKQKAYWEENRLSLKEIIVVTYFVVRVLWEAFKPRKGWWR